MRFPVLATFWMVAGVIILCGLGTWQLQRLAWKTDILSSLEQASRQDPSRNRLGFEDMKTPFVHGHVVGRFLHDKEISIQPRTRDGQVGVHIVTPLVLEGGGVLLVNRGWVALDSDGSDIDRPEGRVVVSGMLRLPERGNWFVPDNQPAAGQWYRLDIEDISQYFGLKHVAPVILYDESLVQDWTLPNNHLQYAIFWFSMAGVLVVIYYLRFIRFFKPPQPRSPSRS